MALKDKKQTEKNHTFLQSLLHAWSGVVRIFKQERNMRIHIFLAVLAIIVAAVLQISRLEWYWIIACIGAVLITETFNTIAENLVDLITEKNYSELGKHIKDMAAGAVLICALFSAFIGVCIFMPKIWNLIFH
ncbi:diacylglycerol kinase family protein [Pediococcus damnosus]|uniref:diacylglycerol kinase family protein n=1 Tax=Pediococcus damnosus TaxID=51663 RepID=UPI00061EF6A2|nr:diacylglycerol kinase family protein [Pediococcus damnosus]AMV70281.1 Diacylglycerol kinase [Pediococcus damnosus]KJU74725.1 UDP kinase [Pediococcus damnosus LMG 28219]PIO81939.1 UDP kinase [Pediococcus damnosus]PIO86184.1 UDP kinase [Pediococcus damnosus]PJE50229.1 UDP kinase [Pediococcus damnosus]